MANPKPALNELLKWSVANSSPTGEAPSAQAPQPARASLPTDALDALFGGPSDADLMKASMEAVLSPDPDVSIADKITAFDNFEQLIESLDNANHLDALGLWSPLLGCLEHQEDEIRMMAAWCVGTAVQNNERCQKRLVELGGVEQLVRMCCDEREGRDVRRKAVYALSSAVRNCQSGMDLTVRELGKRGRGVQGGWLDAMDMGKVDELMEGLREEASKGKSEEIEVEGGGSAEETSERASIKDPTAAGEVSSATSSVNALKSPLENE